MRIMLGLATICVIALAIPTAAHHSHGNYNDGTIDIEGVVKQVVLVVPHSYVYIDVKKGAETETWVLEATSRNGLEKIGVTRDEAVKRALENGPPAQTLEGRELHAIVDVAHRPGLLPEGLAPRWYAIGCAVFDVYIGALCYLPVLRR